MCWAEMLKITVSAPSAFESRQKNPHELRLRLPPLVHHNRSPRLRNKAA